MARILLTEDDSAVRAFVARALAADGHTVTEADDGEDGYDRLIEHEGDFDLLLTDVKMPFMDGIELAEQAAKHYPDLKILMMTGYADQRERADNLDAIIIDVVSKPFTLKHIRQAVNSALQGRTVPSRMRDDENLAATG
ncbi:response regulator [Ahrensia sp. R2A130]|uniref:response regulator n=1 Tax=Ahrensia sp. R2A130 TaxID=744979 RepID=UPI0001E0E8F3|nr:response regulator [Ahrensia sp. R2A130]EFL88013.1 response regulator receiver [Ahrensia sp. R2A130]